MSFLTLSVSDAFERKEYKHVGIQQREGYHPDVSVPPYEIATKVCSFYHKGIWELSPRAIKIACEEVKDESKWHSRGGDPDFGLELGVLKAATNDIVEMRVYFDIHILRWVGTEDYPSVVKRMLRNRYIRNGIGSLAWIMCEDDYGGNKLSFHEICDLLDADISVVRERILQENKVTPRLAQFIKDWIKGDEG